MIPLIIEETSFTTKETSEQYTGNLRENVDLDTMPSVREEFKSKMTVKSSQEVNFLEKFNRRDLENQSERPFFLNSQFQSRSPIESAQKTNKLHENIQKSTVFIKPKINHEEVPNPLRKLKLKERRLSRISSKNSFEEPNKELILTIKDLSMPFPLQDVKGPLEENRDYSNIERESYIEMHKNDDYIEKFLNHKNPLRRNPNEFNEDSDNISRSSLVSMKNCFKNLKNLKFIDVDSESLNSEEILNTRIRFDCLKEAKTEKNKLTNEELMEFMDKTQDFLKNKENSYDINNFIKDMMDIYKENESNCLNCQEIKENPLKIQECFDFEKENLNMKLKCLSPVYREMKISARNNEQTNNNNNSQSNQKRLSMHNLEHRKSSFIQPNFYQKNRDFSEFGQHFAKGNEQKSEENKATYRDIKENINVRKNVY